MSPTKTIIAIKSQKCRCCSNPSSKFLELDSAIKICGLDKTYKDVLYEITNIKVSINNEKSLTQKVCQNCSTQINNCYKFILQARNVYESYLTALSAEHEIKNFNEISEPIIKLPIDLNVLEESVLIAKESPLAIDATTPTANKIKTEPLTVVCMTNEQELMNVDHLTIDKNIKKEQPEYIDYNVGNAVDNDKKNKHYLSAFDNFGAEDEMKDLEDIPEPFIEVTLMEKIVLITKEIAHASKIKTESLSVVGMPNELELMNVDNLTTDNDIKDENPEYIDYNGRKAVDKAKKYETTDLTLNKFSQGPNIVSTHEEQREHFETFNTDSEDDEDAEPIDLSCDICQKIYNSKLLLRRHKQYTHMPEEKKLTCPLCSFKSSRVFNLKRHIGVIHGPEKCREIFKSTDDTRKKYETTDLTLNKFSQGPNIDPTQKEQRDNFETFNTDFEGDEDATDSILKVDFNKRKSKAPIEISCDICHKIYKSKLGLRRHKEYTHMPEEKKVPCPLCSFKTSRLTNLKRHIGIIHGAEKVKEIFKPAKDNSVKFSCSICQKKFNLKKTLRNHIKSKHRNPPKEKERFLCPYCGGSFTSKFTFKRHATIHTGERPFSCKICKSTFKRHDGLQVHRLIHSDEIMHQRLQNSKAFKRSDKLKIQSELRPLTVECMPNEEELLNVDHLTTDNNIEEVKSEHIDYNEENAIDTEKKNKRYLTAFDNFATENGVKDFKDIPVPLIELSSNLNVVEKRRDLITKEISLETDTSTLAAHKIKLEPLSVECMRSEQELMNVDHSTSDYDIKEEEKLENIDYNDGKAFDTDKKYETTDFTLDKFSKGPNLDLTHEGQREHSKTTTDSEDGENEEGPILEDDFDKISCDICHKIYKGKLGLQRHKQKTHMPEEKKLSCSLCSFKTSRLFNLKGHIGVVHGADKIKEIVKPADDNGVKFPCSICQKNFNLENTLLRHINSVHQNPQRKAKVHKEKERFKCTECGGVLIYTRQNLFQCKTCSESFSL